MTARTFTITVNSAPVLSCPSGPITVDTDLGVCTAVVSYTATATGTPTPTISYSFSGATTGSGSGTGSGATFNLGTTTVTLTATNSCGTTTCSFVVVVEDNEDPVITCTTAQTVDTDAGVCTYTHAGTAWDATATDNCSVASITYALSGATTGTGTSLGGVVFNLGVTTVTWTATDDSGNTDVCTFDVTVEDNEDPVVTAGTISSCYPTTAAAEAAAIAATAATDNCPPPTLTASTSMSGCTATITVTATDGSGNSASVTYTTVIDGTAPSLTCPGTQTLTLSSMCTATLPNYTGMATVSDACSTPTVTQSPVPGSSVSGAGPMTVTLTATDACGNSTTCTFTVNKIDATPPVFTSVPANVTIQCNSPLPAPGTPMATDACGSVMITYNGSTTTLGGCPDAYTITHKWTATDGSGNTATATRTVTVIDTQKPNFTSVPANVTVQCNAIPAVGTPTATDNCDTDVAITYNGQTMTAGTCPNRYTLTRRWTATDNCGNTRSTSQVITVIDTQPPFFTTFPANTTISCNAPVPPVGTPTATDACGSATVQYLGQTTANSVCPGTYQIRRTWRATDQCGNSTASTQIIQVMDNTPPVFTSVPGPITINCNDPLPPLVNPTATDACSPYVHITFLGNTPSGSGCAADYTIIRTWRADDLCGNSATATQVITVKALPFSPGDVEERDATKPQPQAPVWDDDRILTLQPNPTTDRVLIGLGSFAGERVLVSIHNDVGQLIWERAVDAVPDLLLPVSLRESGASAGLYTVSVRSSGRVVAKRLVLIE